MENKNEMVNVETVEIVEGNNGVEVISETEDFIVTRQADGKYVRRAKYNDYSSFVANTREDKIWLLNVIEGDEESGNALSDHVGKVIEVQDIITRKYDRVNEGTGEIEYGVLTYLITPEKEVFVTSSKTVYFSVLRIMELFGRPDQEDWVNIKLKVGTRKGQYGNIITVKMVG